MKILVTAFEPFGGQTMNASQMAVERLPDTIGGAAVETLLLPVTFSGAAARLRQAMRRCKPDLVVCVGQAGGRQGVSIERVAVNLADAAIADNAGKKPKEQPVARHGPAAYFSTLPVKKMVQAVQKHGLAASVSNTAGTFVCNAVMYSALHEIAQKGYEMQAGFVHVPFLPEQTENRQELPSMPLSEVVDSLRYALAAAVREATNYTYILQCADGTLYTGWTNDLARRLRAHRSGSGAKYTRAHIAGELVYVQPHLTKQQAMAQEWALKQQTREQKLRLIEQNRRRTALLCRQEGVEK